MTRRLSRTTALILLSSVACLLLPLRHADAALGRDGEWARNFTRQGVDWRVSSLLSTDSRLVIAGDFDAVVGRHAFRIATWDGREASPMGDVTVRALGEFKGRTVAAISPLPSSTTIALWNGARWETIGVADGAVSAIGTYGGELVAAGHFGTIDGVAATSIATWNGSRWAPIGTGFATATAFAIYPYTPALAGGVSRVVEFEGDLYAAGAFPNGTLAKYGIMRWHDGAWSLIEMTGGAAVAFVRDGRLLVGGNFSVIDGTPVSCLAEFDGTTWTEAAEGPPPDPVLAMVEHQGGLAVASPPSLVEGGRIWEWDGTSWQKAGSGPVLSYLSAYRPYVLCLASWNGKLFAAGQFDEICGTAANDIAVWDGSSWSPMGTNGDGIHFTAEGLCGWGDRVVAYGFRMASAGDERTPTAAAWDGRSWTALGSASCVRLCSMIDRDGTLLAGGATGCYPGTVFGLLQWDGAEWVQVGDPLGPPAHTLQVMPLLDLDGQVYVAGDFAEAGGIAAANIARWDGSAWHALGEGLTGTKTAAPTVFDLAVYRGDLVAAGDFTDAGGVPASCIARWDGTEWHPLGEGVTGTPPDLSFPGPVVRALAVYRGDLVAAGVFTHAGGELVNGLARWDGSEWHSFGVQELERFPYDLEVIRGELVVAGGFQSIAGVPARGLAAWTGERWHEIGDGLGDAPLDLLTFHGSLFVAGTSIVGSDIVSLGIAEWRPQGPAASQGRLAEAGSAAPVRGEGARFAGTQNPLGPDTPIAFELPRAGHVRITVYDALGRRVSTLLDATSSAGRHAVTWQGRDDAGLGVAAGVYFVVLDSEGSRATRKVTLLR